MPVADPIQTERILRQYAGDVYRLCCLYLGKYSLAEDAFQDTFLKIHLKWGSHVSAEREKQWVLQVARNTCRDYLRGKWLRASSIEEQPELPDSRAPDLADQVSDGLLGQVMTLPVKYREVVLFRYYYGYDDRQTARLLGITSGNVRTRTARARQQLARLLGQNPDQL